MTEQELESRLLKIEAIIDGMFVMFAKITLEGSQLKIMALEIMSKHSITVKRIEELEKKGKD